MDYFVENLKYMLFLKKQELGFGRSDYPTYLETFARNALVGAERFRKILLGVVSAEEAEKERILERLQIEDHERYSFLNSDMRGVLGEEMRRRFFHHNIVQLLDCLEHGGKSSFAKTLGVNDSTLTRWKSGETMPGAKTLKRIAEIFGLRGSEDLTEGYLFYQLEPATIREKRTKVIEALTALDEKTFEAIYPALIRLVGRES